MSINASTSAHAYGPGMMLHDNPENLISLSDRHAFGSEDKFNQENIISPPYTGTSSPLSTTLLSQDMAERTDLRTLLQQLQGTLMCILNNQAVMEEKHAQLEANLKDIDQKLNTPASVSSDRPICSSGKRKRVVSRVVTVSV